MKGKKTGLSAVEGEEERAIRPAGDHGFAAVSEGKEIKGTVAALRLDAVLALGFGLSRSRAVALIKGGLVQVKGRPVETPSRRLNEGDLISLSGRGSLEITALTGESRKGRQCLILKKFNK
ncbi:MAG: hypothetical protein GX878_10205 [Firmicutes bacterium]|nr:hypothetical protein [Bacillota bacterium]